MDASTSKKLIRRRSHVLRCLHLIVHNMQSTNEKYERLEDLGEGGQGVVFKGDSVMVFIEFNEHKVG